MATDTDDLIKHTQEYMALPEDSPQKLLNRKEDDKIAYVVFVGKEQKNGHMAIVLSYKRIIMVPRLLQKDFGNREYNMFEAPNKQEALVKLAFESYNLGSIDFNIYRVETNGVSKETASTDWIVMDLTRIAHGDSDAIDAVVCA